MTVGRNKTFRAQARTSVSGIILHDIAGNATTRYAWVVLFRPTTVRIIERYVMAKLGQDEQNQPV